jgi:hypothetical protein
MKSFITKSTGFAPDGPLFQDLLTYYSALHGPLTASQSSILPAANTKTPIRDAGVFSNLYVYVPTNTVAATTTITLQKSEVNTAVTVSYTSTQTGIKEDAANSDTFATTDEANYAVVVATDPAGVRNITIGMIAIQFAPTAAADCITFLGQNTANGVATASISVYLVANGQQISTANTEADLKYRVRASFLVSDLYSAVNANTRTTDTVIKTRKNGADGGGVLTYTSTQTGVKEDTVNTDSLAAGDDFNYLITTSTGTGTTTITTISTSWINTSSLFPMLSGRSGGMAQAFNITNYFRVSGSLIDPQTTETKAEVSANFNMTVSELGAYVSANTIATSATVVTFRDNNADSALTVSYAAAQTGLKNDSTNTVIVTAGDEMTYKIVTPNTSGSITFHWVGMLGATGQIKTIDGLAWASAKTVDGTAIASINTVDNLVTQ